MASTTALFSALSGLNANARSLEVIGNNVANSNTTAFKSSRVAFATQFSRTVSPGTSPEDVRGGTNPFQIGLGVQVAGTQRLFADGTITGTGDARDLALEGDGFFIVDRDGAQAYTRAGAFRPDERNRLTNVTGDRLMGFGVDENFQVQTGALRALELPVGSLRLAEASRTVAFTGNLNASGPLPTAGSVLRVQGTNSGAGGLRAVAGATPPPGAGNAVETTTRLLDLEDPLQPGTNAPLFADGQVLELAGATKGSRTVPAARLPIGAGTTLADLMSFLTRALGVSAGAGANPDGRTPGATLDAASGVLTLVGNAGRVNDLDVEPSDLRLLSPTGAFLRAPFATGKDLAADGESVRTSFLAYDSLGATVQADLTMVLDSRSASGTRWRYFVESPDDAGDALALGTGVLDFDTQGRLSSTAVPSVSIDRAGTGALSPLTLDLIFARGQSTVTALSGEPSEIASNFRDGAPFGTLSTYAVGRDGLITGSFTNGLTRTVGQVALARFNNNAGLVEQGSNLFTVGPNSGVPVITTPGQLGARRVVGGALEASNVDLSQEFINMVLASTGYSASSRVIRTTDELIQQLLVLGR